MQDAAGVFLEFVRLDRKRTGTGLAVRELERWSELKRKLDAELRPDAQRTERRASQRVPTRLHCRFGSQSDFEEAVITNLSRGGVFIPTACPLPVGEELKLEIHLAGTGTGSTRIEVEAVVVTNNVGPGFDGGCTGMGLRFAGPGCDAIARIHAFYERTLAEAAAPADA